MSDLTIIIPLYNVEKYINQCISSLYDQSLAISTFDVVVINDGSTDSSPEIVQQFVEKYDNIKLYNFKNAGISEARNRGIELAVGKYIYFIDSDDYLAKDSLSRCLDLVLKNDLDILEFEWVRTKDRNLTKSKSATREINFKLYKGIDYFETVWFHDSVCTSLYRNSLVKQWQLSFKKGKTMEDMLFNIQIIPKAKKVGKSNIDCYRYIINPDSIWNTRDSSNYRKSIVDFDFMVKETNAAILDYNSQGINTEKLKQKQQLMLYNLYKRILQSDLKWREIKEINQGLKGIGVYPLNHYKGNDRLRTLMTWVFNKPIALVIAKNGFNLFKKPLVAVINKKHSN